MEPDYSEKEAPLELVDLDLPEEPSASEEGSLIFEGDDLSLPEPPKLEELDLELAQGSALRSEKSQGFSLESEILSSEEMPQEEPELNEIEQMLGETKEEKPKENLEDVVLVSERDESSPTEEGLSLETEELVSPIPEISFEEAMEGAPSKEEFFADKEGKENEDILFSDEELDLLSTSTVEKNLSQEETIPEEKTPIDKDFFAETGEDEPITLSQEELDGILQDAAPEEFIDQNAEESIALSDEVALSSGLEETQKEDEEISLSEEEMAGILEDAEISDEAPPEDFSATPVSEEISHEDFFAEGEDEPITLTEEELGGILEDSVPVEESTTDTLAELPEIPSEKPEIQPEAVTLTENLEKGTMDISEQRSDDLLQKAQTNMPNREELRKMIAYLDNLLGELPDEVILRFAQSEYYQLYQKVMEALEL